MDKQVTAEQYKNANRVASLLLVLLLWSLMRDL